MKTTHHTDQIGKILDYLIDMRLNEENDEVKREVGFYVIEKLEDMIGETLDEVLQKKLHEIKHNDRLKKIANQIS